jgi:hypothetical protein
MAWRPSSYLLEGELDNTVTGKVTGWMRFAGMKEKVSFDLKGDFHRDIRGTKIRLTGSGREDDSEAEEYMASFAVHQTGKTGDITAGLTPNDYGHTPYFEWFGDDNGRVVIELDSSQVEVLGTLRPYLDAEPNSREEQELNMQEFLHDVAREFGRTNGRPERSPRRESRPSPAARSRTFLLDAKSRSILRPPYSQDGKGGEAIAYVKFFTPDSSFTWYALEFDGNDRFFGLVDGQCKELGYFSLSELETVRGPLGLSIERDLYWKPTKLCEIAPEMFASPDPAA